MYVAKLWPVPELGRGSKEVRGISLREPETAEAKLILICRRNAAGEALDGAVV